LAEVCGGEGWWGGERGGEVLGRVGGRGLVGLWVRVRAGGEGVEDVGAGGVGRGGEGFGWVVGEGGGRGERGWKM